MSSPAKQTDPRQLALLGLQSVQRGAYADAVVHQLLESSRLNGLDRALLTELLYGCVRRQRTLDALVHQFVRKSPPPLLTWILHLGLYQLRYLTQIPAAAAVHSTVDLTKRNGFVGLGGLVNGVLRNYLRQAESGQDPLQLPSDPVARLGVLHSFPDWIVSVWIQQFGEAETADLCTWMNQAPQIDLRINPLITTLEQVQTAFQGVGAVAEPVPPLPQTLRLQSHVGNLTALPGFAEGWWLVQDSSAQLVSHLLEPQPGETIIDACAAPGGKTTHLAELMGDRGLVWACDRNPKRLQKIQENAARLHLQSIQTQAVDVRELQPEQPVDRVLLDVPCSGLGTLHRHADARWRQTPTTVAELAQLQQEILERAVTWVKPGGYLVYSTCTLHPDENEGIIRPFLEQHPHWQIDPPGTRSPTASFVNAEGWLKVLPHQHQMDGFFMVRLRHCGIQ
ncbi:MULTISPECIES: 16S rRNA (cytosine(967)-C(5))-methyltransferase [unclassified Leptolyngbya]|uniref:16S rRNA (cytosine(967)-C(5))-methyltransferase n=1 Tax=unclassified Leptolyngbya TaxID=2650499 RepID=UPI0016841F2C|nr:MULTISPECIES: 16S rRNA (cytosine(967)-C(5))-methyltransferase [unclassified Leptolyngbya]MBD1910650.1 16S rRNA (cytosine(967)-C(5))-methyltransferase [Leptolyngbya sp. FACHB-8]MBD2157164.1 16S rRNA (cytosine(967)-C(5))-methyltransferase [Leptolyngbya sp. FACHB-16]